MKYIKLTLLLPLLVFLSSSKPDDNLKVDICIYGGTSAGVIAAYTAALDGKNVLLIEPFVAENIFKEYIRKGKVNVLFSHRLHKVKKAGKNITEITVENSGNNDQ